MSDVERCPACRARMADSPICGRCGCDLTLVRRAQSLADAATGAALRAWADGAPARALAQVEAALALEDTLLGRALRQALDRACPDDSRARLPQAQRCAEPTPPDQARPDHLPG